MPHILSHDDRLGEIDATEPPAHPPEQALGASAGAVRDDWMIVCGMIASSFGHPNALDLPDDWREQLASVTCRLLANLVTDKKSLVAELGAKLTPEQQCALAAGLIALQPPAARLALLKRLAARHLRNEPRP